MVMRVFRVIKVYVRHPLYCALFKMLGLFEGYLLELFGLLGLLRLLVVLFFRVVEVY